MLYWVLIPRWHKMTLSPVREEPDRTFRDPFAWQWTDGKRPTFEEDRTVCIRSLFRGGGTSSHKIVILVSMSVLSACVCTVCTLYLWKPEMALDSFEFELWTFVSYSVSAGHQELSHIYSPCHKELSKTDFLNWPVLLPGNSWCSVTTMQCEVLLLWNSDLIL